MASPLRSSDASTALAVRDKVNTLLVAARDGNLDLLKKIAQLIDEGQGPAETIAAIKDANGRGALHFAAREGKTEICKYLLEDLKLSVDSRDDDGETPLIHAARQGHLHTAKYLLEHGADPAATSNDLGTTALHQAAGTGCVELINLLLSKGVPVNVPSDAGSPLIWAAGHDRPEAVKALLDHGANPNAETDDDVTALLSAVAAGSLESVELLVKGGANANASASGVTPLHIAADNGNEKMIICLLEAGANPNAIDDECTKPIHAAAAKGNRIAVEILLPVTSPDPAIPDWTVDGLLAYAQHEPAKAQEICDNGGQTDKPNISIESKGDIVEVSPEIKQKSLEAKSRGEDAFRKKDYLMAIDAYTQAIDLDPNNAILLSNRSLCWIRLGQAEQALVDAKACRALRPDWPKACYREGAALRLFQRFDEAANAFYEGVKLDPENKELVDAFREAVEAGRKPEEDQEVDEYLFAEEEAAPRSSEKENAEPSRRSSEVEKEGYGSIREEKEEEEGYAGSSEEEEDDGEEGTGIDSDGERGKNRFAEGSNAFRAAFSKIMEKKVSGDALGPVLSAHKKLIAKKLDEEASELKVKSEAKKEKRLLREKGHVKPESFLDAKEKSLIKLATKGVVKLFNAVSKAQSVQTGYDMSKSRGAKAARKESKAAFLSELRGASLSSSLKPAQFSSVKAHSSLNMEIKNEPRGSVGEPGWAALRDDFMLTSSKLKDWDKMPDAAAIDDLDGMQDVNNGSSSSDED